MNKQKWTIGALAATFLIAGALGLGMQAESVTQPVGKPIARRGEPDPPPPPPPKKFEFWLSLRKQPPDPPGPKPKPKRNEAPRFA